MLVKVICCFAFLAIQAKFTWTLKTGNTGSRVWPPPITKVCTQTTKQKAMYGRMTFNPSLKEKEMTKMNVQVKWNDLQFAPYNTNKKGGVYASYTIGTKDAQGGYFGVQLHARGGQFIFSIWDADRWTPSKKPKPSSKLAWPLNMNKCKRNCQDCGNSPWHKKGLTTGTQCELAHPSMKKGDHFEITLQRLRVKSTINTKHFGGMPKAHAAFGEYNRKVTGGVWVIKVRNVNKKISKEVGRILFEGDGRGMHRLGTFDEMIGCNRCNMIYHSDTRYGPFIDDGGGKIRKPIKMEGKTKSTKSKCKQYYISGSHADTSISFEGGPLTSKSFHSDGQFHKLW